MTTNDWCRCSTASSTSENPRAASVAEISFTGSDYQSIWICPRQGTCT
jgi:hypothetical protein